ncbi:MAG: hypothetical protein AAFU80_16550 [Pseudomonadota bacterium]
MCHAGLLLACEHYPALPRTPRCIDGQLRRWLQDLGHEVTRLSAYPCFAGDLPRAATAADLWIVSGPSLDWTRDGKSSSERLAGFLRDAVAAGRPILALHHAEHLLHAACAAPDAPPPPPDRGMRAIRNPFQSFRARDRLFRFDRVSRSVVELERPQDLRLSSFFATLRHVA